MATAIIGVGNIGGALARDLVRGAEPVVLAAKDEANAAALAHELGEHARAASVEEAIAEADAVVFAVWLDTIKELIAKDADLLEGKVVIDPSNPIGLDENGQMTRTLADDQSAGSVVAALLPTGAHYVKAFGTLAADSLSMAFLVLLESLTPVERAVFLLREVFDYDYAEIAKIVQRSEDNCRQLYVRASATSTRDDRSSKPRASSATSSRGGSSPRRSWATRTR